MFNLRKTVSEPSRPTYLDEENELSNCLVKKPISSSSSSSGSQTDLSSFFDQFDDYEVIVDNFKGNHDNAIPMFDINYDENFLRAFGALRVALERDEISERVFNLTEVCIEFNPHQYSAFALRRKILINLKKNLNDELEFTGRPIEMIV